MNSIVISSIVFSFVFGGALLGMFLRSVLPEPHLNAASKDLVKLGMGTIALMTGLVLGLLVASAKGTYDTQSRELTEMSAEVVMLDRVLAHYGPEAKEIRDLLRGGVVQMLERTWPQDRTQHSQLDPVMAKGDYLYDKLQELSPTNDSQRSLQARALNMGMDLGQKRWLMYEQQELPMSMPLLLVLVFSLAITFISFGLNAPPNATVIATLIVCALSVSGMIFLILEMYRPFEGLIQISSAPLRSALAHLGQ
jgi:hypothetical protein